MNRTARPRAISRGRRPTSLPATLNSAGACCATASCSSATAGCSCPAAAPKETPPSEAMVPTPSASSPTRCNQPSPGVIKCETGIARNPRYFAPGDTFPYRHPRSVCSRPPARVLGVQSCPAQPPSPRDGGRRQSSASPKECSVVPNGQTPSPPADDAATDPAHGVSPPGLWLVVVRVGGRRVAQRPEPGADGRGEGVPSVKVAIAGRWQAGPFAAAVSAAPCFFSASLVLHPFTP